MPASSLGGMLASVNSVNSVEKLAHFVEIFLVGITLRTIPGAGCGTGTLDC